MKSKYSCGWQDFYREEIWYNGKKQDKKNQQPFNNKHLPLQQQFHHLIWESKLYSRWTAPGRNFG